MTVQLVGDPGPAPPALARAILATVDAVLRALPPQQVTLTVLAVGDDVELYLAFDAPSPERSRPDAGGASSTICRRRRAGGPAVNAAEAGGGYLEISWRKDGAA